MAPTGQKILVVDDEKLIRWGLSKNLQELGYAVDEAATAAEAVAAFQRDPADLVLLDFRLPDGDGMGVLRELQKAAPRLPVVMITAHASVAGAVEAMKEGAYDYVGKPFDFDEVARTVERALEAGRLREEVARQREANLGAGSTDIIAESGPMREVMRLVGRVATSQAGTVLLTGESGVGKGVVARTLHFESPAWDKPFMNITCTALPESLLESELFGYEKGAFTDAKAQKKGLFELADGGTIFLDEIGDLSPGMQGKLLRFLEDKAFRRVGGVRDLHVTVRIIAATNKDLAAEVETGHFRSDLYFRLKVIPIEIPPLRERTGDIAPLVRSFVAQFNSEFGKQVTGLDDEAVAALAAYPWPGNVRELRNTIERAVLLSEGPVLAPRDLPREVVPDGGGPAGERRANGGSSAGGAGASGPWILPGEGLSLEELERDLVRQALERTEGNRTRAATLLGMNRDQIRYRIEKFGLDA